MKTKNNILMISKPVVSPWNDSTKNIVRDQVINAEKFNYRIMTTDDKTLESNMVTCDSIYPSQGRYSAGIRQNIKVMLHGLRPKNANLYHYFFAPNTVTSNAGRIQKLVARVKTVQTICSAPASFAKAKNLIFTDRVIVLSQDTKDKLINAGVNKEIIKYIPPGIEPIEKPNDLMRTKIRESFNLGAAKPDKHQLIVFPGDFEFSSAAQTIADAAGKLLKEISNATLIFACRIKTEASKEIQNKIKKQLEHLGNKVVFINEISNMPAFIGACDLILLPSESLYAKMDVPLVLLEAMSQEVPIILANTSPLNELLKTGAGLGVKPKDSDALVKSSIEILNDKNCSNKLGEYGKKAINEIFNAKKMAKSVEILYEEILV